MLKPLSFKKYFGGVPKGKCAYCFLPLDDHSSSNEYTPGFFACNLNGITYLNPISGPTMWHGELDAGESQVVN